MAALELRESGNLWKTNSNDCSSHSLPVPLVDTSLKSGLEGGFQPKFQWNEEQRSWDPSPLPLCQAQSSAHPLSLSFPKLRFLFPPPVRTFQEEAEFPMQPFPDENIPADIWDNKGFLSHPDRG